MCVQYASFQRAKAVARPLHSVNPLALATRLDIFGENKRSVTRLDSDGFGPIAIVEVGALCVGSIVQTYRPGRVERGV